MDKHQLSERDICTKFITPAIVQAGWQQHQFREEVNLTDGRVMVRGKLAARVKNPDAKGGPKRADFVLYGRPNVPIAVVEAKQAKFSVGHGMQQALAYAEMLDAPFAISSNGDGFLLHDRTGLTQPIERELLLTQFPSLNDLWPLYQQWKGLAEASAVKLVEQPFYSDGSGKEPRYYQRVAINRAIEAIAKGQQRVLLVMATGTGKTYTAFQIIWRLWKAKAKKRILFLADRNILVDQTMQQDFAPFGEVMHKVINREVKKNYEIYLALYQAVTGREEWKQIYRQFPADFFDMVVIDECHRSIYGQWRKVLEYFDAQIVGLTATPTKQTLAFFEQNLVSEYTYQESVADEVNVGFDIYRIKTQIGEEGGLIEAGTVIPAIDKRTREQKELEVEEDLDWKPTDQGIAIESPNHIRLVLETFRDRLFSEIFPELNDKGEKRKVVPKTLIFAKSDAHAETIVRIVREVFNKGDGFAAKITYTAKDPADLINRLRTSPELRIAVTVDMVATGTDVKPLECVLFMRDVRSGTYFEQMKGRGARSITDSDFQAVTEQGVHKERFVIVDAIGVTEHDFVDVTVTDRVKTASLESLLKKAAARELTQDDAATLGSRLSKLGLRMTASERNEIESLAGVTIEEMSQQLVRSVSAEALAEAVKNAPEGTAEEVVVHEFVQSLAGTLATSQALRERLVTMHKSKYIIRDEVTPDQLLFAGGVPNIELAERTIQDWKQYMEDNKDEITALQLLYSRPQNSGVTRKQLEELIATIRKPHQDWTPAVIWKSYELLNKTNRSIKNKTVDLVSLVRYTLGIMPELVPFADVVEQRYQGWLLTQEQRGTRFTQDQRRWLDAIKDYICTGVTFETPALDAVPFIEWGGSDGIERDFADPVAVITDLNQALSA